MEVMERDPVMMPTIVRRVHEGVIQVLERTVKDTPKGDVRALCVFWSIEHARRDMYANGCYPEDGWKAIERDDEQLARLFDVLNMFDKGAPRFVYIEPAPGAPELCALLEPEEFIAVLRESAAE